MTVLIVDAIPDGAGAGRVPEIGVREAKGVSDFVTGEATAITADPHRAAPRQPAIAAWATGMTHDVCVVVIGVKAQLPHLVTRMTVGHALAIDVATV